MHSSNTARLGLAMCAIQSLTSPKPRNCSATSRSSILPPVSNACCDTTIDLQLSAFIGMRRFGDMLPCLTYRLSGLICLVVAAALLLCEALARFDRFGGVAAVDRPRLQIAECTAACAEDSAFAHGHSRTDKSIGCHPGVIADGDRRADQRQIGAIVVVRSRAQVGMLAHRCTVAERHRPKAVGNRAVAQTAVAPHREIPR